jgi:hypothetical protein
MHINSFLRETPARGQIDSAHSMPTCHRAHIVSLHNVRMHIIAVRRRIMKRLLLKGCVMLIPLGLMFFSVNRAYGSALTFAPPGTQLDGDPILDILTAPGAVITFTVFYDPGAIPGSPAAVNPLTNIQYVVTFDPTEILLIDVAFGTAFGENSAVVIIPGIVLLTHGGGGAIAPGVSPAMLDRLDFRVLPGINNDGAIDFGFSAVATNALGGGVINITQIAEVQSVPEPSTLLLFGTGLLSILGHNWRRKKHKVDTKFDSSQL